MQPLKLISFLVLSAFTLQSCQQSDLDSVGTIDETKLPDEFSKNVTFVYSNNGIKKFTLESAEINKYIDSIETKTVFPKGVHVIFNDSMGNFQSELFADHAETYEQELNQVHLSKNIKFRNYKEEMLETEKLLIKGDSIYSDTLVTITSKTSIIKGYGLISDVNFTKFKLSRVTGHVQINKKNN